ncbi:MAG: hypothetical protein JF615_14960, partial [Asticcacaulis sp.]|nr:hypothetical protein [Asticcacaulis sp.]
VWSSKTNNGGAGDDYIGGTFAYGNTWDGGTGVDTFDSTLHNFVATINLAAGTYTTVNGTLNILNFENVNAGNQNDTIIGNSSVNRLFGNGGDDILNGGSGYSDYLDGGTGTDTVDYSWVGSGFELSNIVINLTLGTYVDTGGTETLVSIENVWGTQSGESIIGTSGANALSGNGGNDDIDGGAGNDTLNGGDGDDYLHSSDSGIKTYNGGLGDDTVGGIFNYSSVLDGGDGSDMLDMAWVGFSLTPIVIDLTAGTYSDGIGTLTAVNFENYNGFASGEIINGTSGANLINGNDGNDVITGGAGGDTLNGGLGNDTINAGANSDGADMVDGGDGDDVITSSGSGTVTGGNGDDYVYACLGAAESLDGGTGTDTLNTTLFTGDYSVDLSTGVTNYSPESFINFENLVGGDGNDT